MKRRFAVLRLALRSVLLSTQGVVLLLGTLVLSVTLLIPGLKQAFAALLLLLVAIVSSGVLGDRKLQALRGWMTPASVADWELGSARLWARALLLLVAYFVAAAVGRLGGVEFQQQHISFAVLVTLQTVFLVGLFSALLRPPLDMFFFLGLQLMTVFQTMGELPTPLRYALQPTSPAQGDELLRLTIALATFALAVSFFVLLGRRRNDA